MRLGVLIVIALLLILGCCLFRNHVFERFTAANPLQIAWAPSGPNPANIGYNWGVCISQGTSYEGQSNCGNQNPPPPGAPGPGWHNKGQTPQGQNSLVLNNVSCGDCGFGQILTLMLQAVDLVNPVHPTSSWATFTLDLSSKLTPVKNAITDSVAPSEPIYPGSTGFVYTLQFGQPAFAPGNIANIYVQLLRGGDQTFSYGAYVPFTSISSDNTTGILQGSFASGPWTTAPGPLQPGDVLTVTPHVINPGTSQQDGEVYFAGSISQTASTVTPTTPTGIIWNAGGSS